MNAPIVLQPQVEYLESSLATALVALVHFDSLVSLSSLPYQQQQKVHAILYELNLVSDDLSEIWEVH